VICAHLQCVSICAHTTPESKELMAAKVVIFCASGYSYEKTALYFPELVSRLTSSLCSSSSYLYMESRLPHDNITNLSRRKKDARETSPSRAGLRGSAGALIPFAITGGDFRQVPIRIAGSALLAFHTHTERSEDAATTLVPL
jgi:hypothetical protein